MTPPHARALAAALLAAAAATGCSGAPRAAPRDVPAPAAPVAPAAAEQGDRAAIARARADSARLPYTEADVHFMSAMIGHHAQAITMARLAPTHGASATIRTLAGRVVNAQQDEIALMQQWLRDRQQPVPEPDTAGPGAARPAAGHGEGHAGHGMATHDMPMPGMLTAAQLRQLDEARGTEFDRLFLTFMIQHHRGAVAMVERLFGTYGAGQDEGVFRIATDINVDQITEIARMEEMLVTLLLEGRSP